MRFRLWMFAVLLLAGLSGCVSYPDAGLADGNGPVYYDGGDYYAPLRPVDYDVEQRDYVADPYWFPGPYPFFYGGGFYGGYRNRYFYDHHDHHGDGGRHGWDGNHAPVSAQQTGTGVAPTAPVRPAPAGPVRGAGGGGGAHAGHR